jgi:hypothetical protein
VRNRRLIPTITALARRERIGLPDFFEIRFPDGTVAGGGRLEGPELNPEVKPQVHRPHRLRLERGVGSHGEVRAEWILTRKGEGDLEFELVYRSQKGGTIQRSFKGEAK